MRTTTVFLDAGGVILNEAQHEEARAELAVEVLRPVVPGYSVSQYFSDIEEAVRVLCPSAYQYVFWKYLKNDRSQFDELFGSFRDKWK